MVRPMLSDRCAVLSCLSVLSCLWRWRIVAKRFDGSRWNSAYLHYRPHCVRWGPSSPQKGHSSQFSAHVYCSQTAGWLDATAHPYLTVVNPIEISLHQWSQHGHKTVVWCNSSHKMHTGNLFLQYRKTDLALVMFASCVCLLSVCLSAY